MEALDHPIRFGMVWSCDDGFNAPSPGQLLEDFGDKLRAAVGCDGGGDAEGLYPSESKAVYDALGGDVHEGDGDGPTREAVYYGKEVFETI